MPTELLEPLCEYVKFTQIFNFIELHLNDLNRCIYIINVNPHLTMIRVSLNHIQYSVTGFQAWQSQGLYFLPQMLQMGLLKYVVSVLADHVQLKVQEGDPVHNSQKNMSAWQGGHFQTGGLYWSRE